MSLKKLRNQVSRNGFDLSRKNIFSAKVGELLPVLTMECIPGDKFKINLKNFTRTQPVNTAAYTRLREYFDFFFVPTELLWHKYNTWVSQMVDNNQHAKSIKEVATLTDTQPHFPIHSLLNRISSIDAVTTTAKNPLGFNRGTGAAKLLSYLNYGQYVFNPQTHEFTKKPTLNYKMNPFPLLAYQKIYADYYRNSQWEKSFAPAFNIDYIQGNSDLEIPVGSLSADYGQMFDLRYANFNKDYFMGILPNAQFGDAASVILPGISLGETSLFKSQGNYLIARQNVNYTVNATISKFVDSDNVPNSKLANTSDAVGNMPFALEASDVSRLRESLGLSSEGIGSSSFTILALRQAEALQKWQEITQSRSKDYKSQMEAHFGVTLDDSYSDKCKFIGGIVNNVDINEVVNTNITASHAAEIAGKGIGVGDGNISFSTDVHGILMCVYHSAPLLDYNITGIDKLNLKTLVTDYAIPEFDKTGMVEVTAHELVTDLIETGQESSTLGYAPRYYDYKTAFDRIHGAFVNGGLDAWTAPITSDYLLKALGTRVGNIHANWLMFQISPSICDTIFAVNAGDTEESDQLLVNSSFDIKAVRNLDYNGLPY